MKKSLRLHRRTFLKGVGASMALPLLDAMLPSAAAASTGTPSLRMAFVFFPNGAIMPDWKPSGEGENFTLPPTLEPLASLRGELNVLTGLAQDNARAKGDGPGDHARSAATFLTGEHPVKTAGADIRAGKSVDQVAAEIIGNATRLPSLEIGIEKGRNAGQCDSGYSCAYSNNISWKTPTTPMAKEINPKLVFERLFGAGTDEDKSRAQRELFRKSILDLVADDAAALKKRLGQTDRRKMDEYFSSVRELEQRIERAREQKEVREVPDIELPDGIPQDQDEHVKLMYDLLALAFETDTTRVATYMLANEGSNRTYPMVDVKDGHHHLSHHQNKEDWVNKLKKIDKYLVTRFAYFLDKLKSVKEGEGTLLDNCMIVYGSAIGDGNRHNHNDLPILLAGRGGGTIKPGRHVTYSENTPLNNLFLSMLDRVGAPVDRLGDSTGRLTKLDG